MVPEFLDLWDQIAKAIFEVNLEKEIINYDEFTTDLCRRRPNFDDSCTGIYAPFGIGEKKLGELLGSLRP